MDKVIFLRSQLPETDSRLQRYISILNNYEIEYIIIGWNRQKHCNSKFKKNVILFNKLAPIGGGISNINSLFFWNLFLFKVLWTNRKNYSSIHSIDFDTAIPALIVSKLLKKKYIFDVYDKYTDARSLPSILKKIIDKIERLCVKNADILILPDGCRRQQLELPNNIPSYIIENIPNVPDFKLKKIELQSRKIILSYVGILERNHRGLENLIKVVSQYPNKIILNIAGAGDLQDYVELEAKTHSNINFLGSVSQKQALEIMQNSHIIVGLYYTTIKNHLYASPNKYYESLYLGKPLLTSSDTPVAEKVLKFNTGFVIGQTSQHLIEFIDNISMEKINEASNNSFDLWSKKYLHYNQIIANQYVRIILDV